MAIMMTAATVMKAITTMNNCYTGHDSYLLEWEGYISKVLINYEFFFSGFERKFGQPEGYSKPAGAKHPPCMINY